MRGGRLGTLDLNLNSQITTNLIRADGHIKGLSLTSSQSLTVRNFLKYNNTEVPIRVETQFVADATGVLQMVFDADPWRSLISFDPGVTVTRGGTLQLDFAPGVDVFAQIGRTIRIFDWTGVSPTGTFTVSSYFIWDTSNLYTTGEVKLTGTYDTDFNNDGVVDGLDFILLQQMSIGPNTARDLANFNANFGHTFAPASAVPEPAIALLAVALLAPMALRRKR